MIQESTACEIELPGRVGKIISLLNEGGYEAYAVGGCVRDSLLGRAPSDWDITTTAHPAEIKNIFNKTVDTGIQHGTVTVLMGGAGFEVTTYRIDGPYRDGRHPETVEFTPELKEDLLRRDFTINAMAYHPKDGIVDPFGGRGDLKSGLIRCVGDPGERFSEDALRMMRAVRFAAQLGFDIDEKTFDAVRRLSGNIGQVSAERIREELLKLLESDRPEKMDLLREAGLTAVFLPEYDAMFACEQNTRHHIYDVGHHTLKCVERISRPDRTLRLSALFHDIGKPVVKKTDKKGIDHFVGHPQAGERITRRIMRRLKFDNDTSDAVCRLVRFHDERPPMTRRNVRRLMARAGLDCMEDLIELKRADIAAQSDFCREEKFEQVDALEKYYREILAGSECVSLRDLSINGRDIMELGVGSGPEIGEILRRLLSMVIDDPAMNARSVLLDEARRITEKKQ